MEKIPVVTILGHIDHGKTSLLRAIKGMEFSPEKPGGKITQEIGAFEIEVLGKKITFLDTPGHEAFFQMRSRGAKVADLAILAVSAIEGPKEQTKEAFEAIKEAKIPFLVAITKMDLPGANSKKVERELSKFGIFTESQGGEVPVVETSAKTKEGIKELLEMVLLLAEVKGLKANLKERAKGVIIESKLDEKRGPLATLILEAGILKLGQILATDSAFGKIKAIESPEGKRLKEVFPGQACLILGFEKVPMVGEIAQVFENLEKAKANLKEKKLREIFFEPKEGQKVLNLILKADCLGSLEAVQNLISKIPQEKVLIRIIQKGVGLVSEEDLKLAKTSKALIFAFRTKPDKIAKKILEREKIKVFSFDLIYDLVEALRKIIQKILEPQILKREIGKVKVLVEFWKSRNRQIVGGRVIEGEVKRQTKIEVWRGENLVGKGKLINIQKERRDIEKAKKGEEIGILYEGEGKIKVDDILVFFVEEKRKIF